MTADAVGSECIPWPWERLEASLRRSREALLALDLAGIEAGTREQVSLFREFDALLRRSLAAVAATRTTETTSSGLRAQPELEEELRRSRDRILDALRLQAALLARAQSKLRILANMLAGPTVPYYGPSLAGDRGLARALNWKL